MNAATLDGTLRRLGSAPVTVADLDVLEVRLLSAIGAPPQSVALVERRRRRITPLLVGAVAASLLALVVLAAGWFAAGDDPYVLSAAVDVEVVLPDGDVVDGTVGLELPIGSVLNVGGSMEIDGTSYGPGDYVITDDGPVAADDLGGDGGAPGGGINLGGDGGGGAPVVATSTTEPVRPGDGLDIGETTVPPQTTDSGPTTTARPAVGDETEPTAVVPDRTTVAPDRPPRATTTTAPSGAPPKDTTTTTRPSRDAPPKDTTTTTRPSRDAPPKDTTTTTRPPRDRP